MAYQPIVPIAPRTILGNPDGSAAPPREIPLAPNLAIESGELTKIPNPGRTTTGYDTVVAGDHLGSITSLDDMNTILYLPGGFPRGFKFKSHQGGVGQVEYRPINGATLVNAPRLSGGPREGGFYAEIENLGNDQWIVVGRTTDEILKWSIYGQTSVDQGDAVTYVVIVPSLVDDYPAGVTIDFSATNISEAGYDKTLAQALAEAVALDPTNLSFDGTNTVTIKPAAKRPFTFNFFAVPEYEETSDVTVTITISSPSQGAIASGADEIATLRRNTSKPHAPSLLFPSTTLTTVGTASSGQNEVVVTSVSGLVKYGTVTHDDIPALTWITDIDASTKTLTLSANLSDNIADASSLTYTPPGFHFNFSNADNITKDGSNKVSQAVDLIHGYTLDQATGANQPTWTASSLNSLGGLTCTGSHWLSSTSAPLGNIFDAAAQKYSLFIVAKLTSAASSGAYMGCEAISLKANTAVDLAFAGDQAVCESLSMAMALNLPYAWDYCSDGNKATATFNGHRLFVPATLTEDMAIGSTSMVVDDASGVLKEMQLICPNKGVTAAMAPRVNTVVGNTITLFPGQVAQQVLPAGTTVHFLSRTIYHKIYTGLPSSTTPAPARVSTQFVLGSAPDSPSNYFVERSISHPSTVSTNAINAVIYEVIAVPRLLTSQERRGLLIWLANKWGVTVTKDTAVSASANEAKLTLSSVSNIYTGQTITGHAGLDSDTTVLAVNASTNVIKIDPPLVGSIPSGTFLSFKGPTFAKPKLLSITNFRPRFRDDFTADLDLSNSTWIPHYNIYDPNSTFNYNGAYYGTPAFGSSNGGTTERTWYLDVLNYAPWRKYSPFSISNPAEASSGQLVITASPVPDAIANLIGYNPPNPTKYDYISGYIRQSTAGAASNQYGYYEIRARQSSAVGGWPVFWLTAIDGIWPPEIDIMELDTSAPGFVGGGGAIHSNLNYENVPTYTDMSAYSYGWIEEDSSTKYSLYGCEWGPDFITFYHNRERQWSTPTPQDLHTPLHIQLNVGAFGKSATQMHPDLESSITMEVDYVSVWKRNLQTPTLTGATQAETTALIAAMTAPPTDGGARVALINATIERLKLTNSSFGIPLWDALDFLYVLSAHNAQAARINWKNPALIANPVGSPTFVTDLGYTGASMVSYLDTGINLSTAGYTMTPDLNHIGAITGLVTNGQAFGCTDGTLSGYGISPRSTSMSLRLMNSETVSAGINYSSSSTSHFIGTRNFYHIMGHKNGVTANGTALNYAYNIPVPRIPLPNKNLFLANGNGQLRCAHGGTYLTPDDVSLLYDILYTEYFHPISAL